jgi:hypothetical protein
MRIVGVPVEELVPIPEKMGPAPPQDPDALKRIAVVG